MGRELAEKHAEAKKVFDEADRVLGFPISRMCFSGGEEDLKQTANTQPAILTVSVATYCILESRGIRPEIGRAHV